MKQSIFQILKLVIVSLLIYSLLLLIHDTEGSKLAHFSPTFSIQLLKNLIRPILRQKKNPYHIRVSKHHLNDGFL